MTDPSAVTAVEVRRVPAPATRATTRRELRPVLLMAPVLILGMLVALYVWVRSNEIDSIEARVLNSDTLWQLTREHLKLTGIATVLILVLAIPGGILLSRPWARPLTPVVLGIANIGQAFPAIGLLILLTMKFGIGVRVALISIVVYGLLPILRNTLVGLQQIDKAVIESARGMGLTSGQTLLRVELPLAVPVILAGVRTTLVLTVGVATLATFVNAGGLGSAIVTGLKLQRTSVTVTGAVLVMSMAFFLDWLARVAEEVLRPRGI